MLTTIKKLFVLLPKKDKIKWLLIAVLAFLVSFMELITASVIVVFAQVLTEPNIDLSGNKFFSFLTSMIGPDNLLVFTACAVLFTYVLKNALAAFEAFFQNFTVQMISYQFKQRLLERYSNIDYNVFLKRNSASIMQIIGSDIDVAMNGGMICLGIILSEAIVFIGLLALIIFLNPVFALIFLPISGLIYLFVTRALMPRFYNWGKEIQHNSEQSIKNLMQFFHAFKEVVLLKKQDYFLAEYQKYSYTMSRIRAVQTATQVLPRLFVEVLFVGVFIVAILYLSYQTQTLSSMFGILAGYLYAGFRLMPGLNRIITQLNNFKGSMPAINRICEEYSTYSQKGNYQDIPEFQFKKDVTLSNVSFSYAEDAAKPSLSNINFTIKKGDMVGIYGETGSGKSTLVDLIIGLQKPDNGSVLIDQQYPADCIQWHKTIAYVPQSIYLIDDTIKSNIAFGVDEKDIDAEQLNKVTQMAQLDKLIAKLPDGFDTIVGERGIRLSGGERQRIAIARALYTEPKVLIFDEATSALDNATETRLMETINNVAKNKTVIMIAHRLSTLDNCNLLIQLKNGEILSQDNGKRMAKGGA